MNKFQQVWVTTKSGARSVFNSRLGTLVFLLVLLFGASIAAKLFVDEVSTPEKVVSAQTATFEPVPTWTPTVVVQAAIVRQEQVAQVQPSPTPLPTAVVQQLPTVTPTSVTAVALASEGAAFGTNVQADNAAAVAAAVAAPVAQQAPEVFQLQNPPLTKAQADAILVEIDAEVTIEDRTPGYRDVRFGVTSLGQQATGSVIFDTNKVDSWTGRLVCDDICNGFYLLRASDGAVIPLQAQVFYPPDMNYASVQGTARQVAIDYGINVEQGELLAQHLFTTPVTVSPGDKLIVVGRDDPQEGVNRGFFFSWRFIEGQEVLVGPLNVGK